ncbi:dehydrogenase with different specificitie [Aaosphaeria arxii CBS 175.79]|uniref:Dehydrogenase with different specificitie n=1 Tax=Aaosphaeria arxii CBS 175.79 TaxID=1450172 RepID=A0A6A5XFL8_9PLEO|nr:dehydrogenase with different specificitie [Aaosphaeria arxii CBS 175.79]KAF2011730.1 dehydrogenase with different specificitie [Aaosphaeria arxii CBS 175.79]
MSSSPSKDHSSPQHLPLKGKVAIVTGSSRGIGASIAIELARRGANITIVFTSPGSEALASEVVSKIEKLGTGSRATKVQADLSTVEAGDKIVAATLETFGQSVDILVNNAAVEFDRTILDTTPEDYARMFDVNVRGPILMTKAVLLHLRAPGRIINVSSVGSRIGFAKMALYCSSKAALEGLTRCWAAELGDDGHTVNTVNPGPTASEMLDNVDKEFVDIQLKTTPVGHRVGTSEEIAQVVGWLAEEQSKWISGQSISASGGFLML